MSSQTFTPSDAFPMNQLKYKITPTSYKKYVKITKRINKKKILRVKETKLRNTSPLKHSKTLKRRKSTINTPNIDKSPVSISDPKEINTDFEKDETLKKDCETSENQKEINKEYIDKHIRNYLDKDVFYFRNQKEI